MHEGLKNCGLRFEKKGSGAIIWVGDTAVKASSVDRSFSMGKLVKKLGEFVAGNYEEELGSVGTIGTARLERAQQMSERCGRTCLT